VGKKSGACPWVAGHGETGLLVNVNDPQNMARSMRQLAIDDDARRAFSGKAIRRAREVFSLEAVASRYLEMYTKFIG